MATASQGAKGGVGQRISPSTVFHTGGLAPGSATVGTDTTPVVTETYLAEIFVPANTVATGVALLNGSAVAGNITLFIADGNGNVLGSTASTAQSGTAAYQQVALSASLPLQGPNKYYVGLQCNNTSARFRSHAVGNFGAGKLTSQTYGTLPGFTAPTTFTANLGPIASIY